MFMADGPALVLYYDGICHLCYGAVKFILRHEKRPEIYFAALQSDVAQPVLSKIKDLGGHHVDSLIFQERNNLLIKSEAALALAKYLKFPYNLVQVFYLLPRKLRNYGYDWVAGHRYRWFGKEKTCILPDLSVQSRFIL